MRSVQRNRQTIYYALRVGSTEVVDKYGNATGEFVEQYMKCPIAEDTILWVGIPTTEPYNYVVKKLIPCINQLLIGLQEVNGETNGVSEDNSH